MYLEIHFSEYIRGKLCLLQLTRVERDEQALWNSLELVVSAVCMLGHEGHIESNSHCPHMKKNE